jgi:hypothetical protein
LPRINYLKEDSLLIPGKKRMAESDRIYSSKIKFGGYFNFKDFYKFCYEWIDDEVGITMQEGKYVEKVSGTSKDIEIEWSGKRKFGDYFGFKMKVDFRILGMTSEEVVIKGVKKKMNKGSIEIKVSSDLIKDHQGKFETSAFYKFLRAMYEKWIITSRVEAMEGKIFGDSDEFLAQAKAYLDLTGKR